MSVCLAIRLMRVDLNQHVAFVVDLVWMDDTLWHAGCAGVSRCLCRQGLCVVKRIVHCRGILDEGGAGYGIMCLDKY